MIKLSPSLTALAISTLMSISRTLRKMQFSLNKKCILKKNIIIEVHLQLLKKELRASHICLSGLRKIILSSAHIGAGFTFKTVDLNLFEGHGCKKKGVFIEEKHITGLVIIMHSTFSRVR